MRYFLFLVFFLLAGCSVKESNLVLLDSQCRVERVNDDYGVLFEMDVAGDELPVIGEGESEYKKVYPDMGDFLKSCIVKYSGACLYPWSCEKKPKKVFEVKIESIFYDKKSGMYVAIYSIDQSEFTLKRKAGDLTSFLRYLASQIGRYILSKSS